MASVAGLAPARLCLKGRLRELLCIHGHEEMKNEECKMQNGNLASRLHFTFFIHHLHLEVVPGVGIAPTSPRLQRGANLSQLPGGNGLPSRSRQAKVGRPAR